MCVLTATVCNGDRQREGIQQDAGSAQYPDLEVPDLRKTTAHGTNVNRGWTGKCSDPDAIEKENGVQLTVEKRA
ncbi:hypothetical protein I315_02572 [Cryptococcus gattii Ru294]|uniref:Uncharacterized protein n=2 Tax=Cryptococcus gattii TaxID=37769 RepID=E6R9Y7_CRYGW|nr:Hypothetical Protein CGB_G5590W [Cryptococcus gattii WM276]KIR54691.1 hypothetical protein I315_02572 [Cryptococcus gattii Ru294]KIR77727.1 hypothetical protein I306_05463 [Cryptococcus gattii EJB2]KIY36033.1 hypothetical protein I305_01609 [Cryptococcus gattii E566]KJE05531.1 hypothetical protein I311_00737 [Cryptococcus gattii NT-10]ADV23598.1 Hypothetical Protein CGB_G5590W [Cryptococcus gattii WM276]